MAKYTVLLTTGQGFEISFEAAEGLADKLNRDKFVVLRDTKQVVHTLNTNAILDVVFDAEIKIGM